MCSLFASNKAWLTYVKVTVTQHSSHFQVSNNSHVLIIYWLMISVFITLATEKPGLTCAVLVGLGPNEAIGKITFLLI